MQSMSVAEQQPPLSQLASLAGGQTGQTPSVSASMGMGNVTGLLNDNSSNSRINNAF